jgi:hypothetical protein
MMNDKHSFAVAVALGALGLVSNAAHAADPCEGVPRCFNAGTFVAEVVQVLPTAAARGVANQTVSLNIRFRNVSEKPIILAYRANSGMGTDNFGNQYYWGRAGSHDQSVKGIGIVTSREVDTQFALTPGQARNATFNVTRFGVKPPIGEAYNYDFVIDEVEILPGQVVRSKRQNSINFVNLTPGTFNGSAAMAGSGGAGGDPIEAAGRVIDLFNKAKKKN